MGIGNYKFCFLVCYSFGIAIGNLDLINRIYDIFTVFLLIKIIPGIFPVVILRKFYHSARCFTICIKLYLNCSRADAILIVVIIPNLFYRNLCNVRNMGIGNYKFCFLVCDFFFISCRYLYFIHSINNILIIFHSWKSFPSITPVIFF